MLGEFSSERFGALTSTRSVVPTSEMPVLDNCFFTTGTSAKASASGFSVVSNNRRRFADNCELAEDDSGEVNCVGHKIAYSISCLVAVDRLEPTIAASFLPLPTIHRKEVPCPDIS